MYVKKYQLVRLIISLNADFEQVHRRSKCTHFLFSASKFDPCLMKPCHNGGKCQGQEIPPYYRCECDSMWAGTDCEIKGAFFQLNVKWQTYMHTLSYLHTAHNIYFEFDYLRI